MSRQVNVPLDDERALVLAQVALRDEASVPEVLRPVIERFLADELARDADLRAAVEALGRARSKRRASSRVARLTPKPTGEAGS